MCGGWVVEWSGDSGEGMAGDRWMAGDRGINFRSGMRGEEGGKSRHLCRVITNV